MGTRSRTKHASKPKLSIMSFEFVNSTPEQLEQDEEAKKTVRVQVMRDFRRRQRQEVQVSAIARPSSSRSPIPQYQTGLRIEVGSPEEFAFVIVWTISNIESQLIRQAWDAYRWWLISYVTEQNRVNIIDAPWHRPTTDTLLFALYLESISRLRALGQTQFAFNQEQESLIKIRVLESIRQRLSDDDAAIMDNTIAALASLTSYEISCGSAEATVHMRGIHEVINLRAAHPDVQNNAGLSTFLQILDIIHAIAFNTPVLFASRISNEHDMMESPTAWSHGRMSPNTRRYELEAWHTTLLEARANALSTTGGYALPHALTLAADVYYSKYHSPAQSPGAHQSRAPELFNAVVAVPEQAWAQFAMLRLRILVTGLATATNASYRSWYIAHLSRLLYCIDLERWPLVKDVMLRFINMTSSPTTSGTQSRVALANDVEIVMDPDEEG